MPPVPLPSAPPLPYAPHFEQKEEDEDQTARDLADAMRTLSEKVAAHEGHAHRSVHAKSHGLLQGRLTVLAGLPEPLAQGLFATPGEYPVVMRLSTVPGDLLEDAVSTPRGLALKVVGVHGARALAGDTAVTQDFVMVNAPAFNLPGAKRFLSSLKLLAATAVRAPTLKKVISTTLRGVEAVVEQVGEKNLTLSALGGQQPVHPLGDTYHTQAPLLHGRYMAKLSLAPVSPNLTALTGSRIDLGAHPNALREAVRRHFADQGATWELRVQLCTDLQAMPIEDASVEWPEDLSPHVAVARVEVPPQEAWSEARAAAVDDGMAFSPWHALAAHRPLGSIMRVRLAAYEAVSRYRADRNGRSVDEPRSLDTLPA